MQEETQGSPEGAMRRDGIGRDEIEGTAQTAGSPNKMSETLIQLLQCIYGKT